MPTPEQVTDALRAVIDPELRRSIVDLGMVRSIDIQDSGKVEVVVSLTTAGCPIRSHFQQAVALNVSKLDGVTEVGVGFDVLSDEEKSNLQQALGRPGGLPEGALAAVKNVICIASGKGGVGKSTMTANLAAALQTEGKTAGALDADVYGYSIPRMLGVDERPDVNGERKIIPPLGPAGIKVMSIGFFLEHNAAVVWRGPMLHKAIQQFLEDVAWEDLDYLLLDLPPGTGDVSMTLAQLLPQARVIVVTTPQPAAQSVAKRAADMAAKVDLEVLGVIENMSGFTTPDGQRFTIFGEGGGQLLADELDVPLLGKVPLSEDLRVGADGGMPLVLSDPDAAASVADPPGSSRNHRHDPPGAAGDAGGDAHRRSSRRAGERNGTACRPSPGLGAHATVDARLEPNREFWDERVAIHVDSDFYDVERFKAGASTLRPFEIEEMGPIEGKRMVHLQCHFGLDSLSWARRGATVVGVDFSAPAVEAANALAKELGLDARFVAADVYDAAMRLGDERFDVVYTGLGALNWLPDLTRWARVVTALLAPGGFLYLSEFHPLTWVLADDDLTVERSYFHDAEGVEFDDPGTYADLSAQTSHNATHEWAHSLAEVVGALLDAGLRLELFSEHDFTLFERWPFLVADHEVLDAGTVYRLPDEMPRLPLMYSLRARRA